MVPGAIAYYRFDEGAGQILHDYSGNGNHGTLGSTAGVDTNDPAWNAQGLVFAGDDHVNCGTGVDASVAGLTVMAVVNSAADTEQAIAAKGVGTGATGTGWYLEKRTGANRYAARVYDSTGAFKTCFYPSAHANGTWGMISLVADGLSIRLYSGISAGTPVDCVGLTPAPAQQLVLGKLSYTGGFYLTGGIAAIYALPFALSPSQIAQTYAYEKAHLAPKQVFLP